MEAFCFLNTLFFSKGAFFIAAARIALCVFISCCSALFISVSLRVDSRVAGSSRAVLLLVHHFRCGGISVRMTFGRFWLIAVFQKKSKSASDSEPAKTPPERTRRPSSQKIFSIIIKMENVFSKKQKNPKKSKSASDSDPTPSVF